MTTQTRLVSLFETCVNTAIGFGVAFAIWPAVAWFHGLPYSHSMNFTITLIFTITSIVRGYCVRRFFAKELHRVAEAWARRAIKWLT